MDDDDWLHEIGRRHGVTPPGPGQFAGYSGALPDHQRARELDWLWELKARHGTTTRAGEDDEAAPEALPRPSPTRVTADEYYW